MAPVLSTLVLAGIAASGAATAVGDTTDHWAVLIAGSSGYGNYRHQADVCHAYQVVLKAGIPAEKIITLAYDDVANNFENPYKGQLFNKPTPEGTPGVDVYAGCQIDYTGSDVTPDTFASVLTGDKQGVLSKGNGKVLESTASSRVFVNFVDHGGVGIIGFPRTTMHAKELVGALTKMHDRQMYKELVFYLEACESGSMFQTLPEGISIYATTAANAKESSWGTYCMPDDKVDGKEIRSCLGDLYSVNWMEDSDVSLGQQNQTLGGQFDKVVRLTSKSHPLEFGDSTDFRPELINNFQGSTDAGRGRIQLPPTAGRVDGPAVAGAAPRGYASLPSADAELASAYARFMASESPTAGAELIRGVQERLAAAERFDKIAKAVTGVAATGERPEVVDMECHFTAHKAYVARCGEWTVGALKHSATLAELCAKTGGDTRAIVAAITEACAAEALVEA